MEISREKLSSPPVIFVAYMVFASVFILVFRAIFAGEDAPLPAFSQNWGMIRGVLDIVALFPALAFSALVVPYGIASEENYLSGFSEHMFQQLMGPLITAICAAGVYAALFFLALPLAQNYEESLRYQGDVYRLHKERAQEHIEKREWLEALQLIGICESVWKESPDIAALRKTAEYAMGEEFYESSRQMAEREPARNLNSASVTALPGQGQPIDAASAIEQAEAALADDRLFDAHWLATLGRRIAGSGSPESTQAARLAARAWNQIELQRPNRNELRVHALYREKLAGYEAMISGDWIRAYYLFLELREKTPNDPDVENFIKACEKGINEIAFFVDEIELSLGETFANTIFSLPIDSNPRQSRAIMRLDSLSSAPDYAYGAGLEYIVFDHDDQPLLHLKAPYAKFLPIMLNDQNHVLIMLRTLDRHDVKKSWVPELLVRDNTIYRQETAQITLNISYEVFVMLSQMRQDLPALHLDELFVAAMISEGTGYIPEVFQAEILNRLGACLFFLPMAVFSIIVGWQLRAKYRPRYLFVLLLPILPLVFNVIVHLYRTILNTAGITLIFNLGFSHALPLFIGFIAFMFVVSLLLLAAQHD